MYWNVIRATADTAERTSGGFVDPGKWRENQVGAFAFCAVLNFIMEDMLYTPSPLKDEDFMVLIKS